MSASLNEVQARYLLPGDYLDRWRDTVAQVWRTDDGRVYVQFTNDGYGVCLPPDRAVLVK